jgi:hypothetical protein
MAKYSPHGKKQNNGQWNMVISALGVEHTTQKEKQKEWLGTPSLTTLHNLT